MFFFSFIRHHPIWTTIIILIIVYIMPTTPQPIMPRQSTPAAALPSKPSPSTAPVASNVQIPPQEKEYLKKASGFLIHNHEVDKEMASCMQRAHDHTINIMEIRGVISHCRSVYDDEYANYLKAPPPISYKNIDAKINRYAKIRLAAFNELSRGFGSDGLFVPKGGLPHVERGRDQYIESMRQGDLCLQELNKRLAQLEAQIHKDR